MPRFKLLFLSTILVIPLAAATDSPAHGKIPCQSLSGFTIGAKVIGLPTSGATITSAELVASAPQKVEGDRIVLAIPEYCKVVGAISPVDSAAPKINFQVNLPSSWNRKIAQMGGSGANGVIPVALTTGMQWGPESIPPNAPYALSRGFLTYGSDSGHQNTPLGRGAGGGRGGSGRGGRGPGGRGTDGAEPGRGAVEGPPPVDWSTIDEAEQNFAFAQMKKTHDVTVALVAKFYGQPIRHSYYLGSSQGGREAMIVVQRFPKDYDGVFAQVPAIFYTQLSIGDPLARAKTQTGDGWIPPAKVALIGKEVLRQCDALDGIEDGLVSNYLACYKKFDQTGGTSPFAALRCPNGADTGEACLSDAQIKAADAVHATVTFPFDLAYGWHSLPGWGTGSESAANWKTFPARPTSATNFGVLRSRIVKDPTVNLMELNLADYANQIRQYSTEIDATNPDLSAFQKRGGKLIMKVNTTDYTVNPRWVMDYVDKVVSTMGASKTDTFLRFYVASGLFHNRNVGRNPLTNELVPAFVDFITLLDEWVEHGKAPSDTQVLTDMEPTPPFAIRSSLPMCRYPMYPRYKGAGDPKTAESYTCSQD